MAGMIQVVEFIEPTYLRPPELDYELGCRGLAREAIGRMSQEDRNSALRQLQESELSAGTCPGYQCTYVKQEDAYITGALREIREAFKAVRDMSEQQRRVIRARIVHLYNRARRLDTRSRSGGPIKERLLAEAREAPGEITTTRLELRVQQPPRQRIPIRKAKQIKSAELAWESLL